MPQDDEPEVRDSSVPRLLQQLAFFNRPELESVAGRRRWWAQVEPAQYLTWMMHWNGTLRGLDRPVVMDNTNVLVAAYLSGADPAYRPGLLLKAFDGTQKVLRNGRLDDKAALERAGQLLGGAIILVHGWDGANGRLARVAANAMIEGYDGTPATNERFRYLVAGDAYPWSIRPADNVVETLTRFAQQEMCDIPTGPEFPSGVTLPFGSDDVRQAFTFRPGLAKSEEEAYVSMVFMKDSWPALYKVLSDRSLVAAVTVPHYERGVLQATQIDAVKAAEILDAKDLRKVLELDSEQRKRRIEIFIDEMVEPSRTPSIAQMQQEDFERAPREKQPWFELHVRSERSGNEHPRLD